MPSPNNNKSEYALPKPPPRRPEPIEIINPDEYNQNDGFVAYFDFAT